MPKHQLPKIQSKEQFIQLLEHLSDFQLQKSERESLLIQCWGKHLKWLLTHIDICAKKYLIFQIKYHVLN